MSRENLLKATRANLFQIIGIFILIGSISFWSMGGCTNKGGGDGFPQPREINSRNGVLRTILETLLATNFLENSATGEIDEVNTPTYNGNLVGPTFRINPGDSIQFDIINSFPPNPENQRLGAFPKDPYTTNYHSHGLTVSPDGISDNVFRRMTPSETPYPVQIDVGSDHQSGTFWYHPHKHGSVSFSFFGGMSGFIIIEGGPGDLNEVPEIAAAREVLMLFSVIRTDKNGDVPFVNQEAVQFSTDNTNIMPPVPPNGLWATFMNSNSYFVTNGVTNPTLKMRPGEVQRWRLLDAASGETLPIALQGHSLHVLANDGINVPEMITLGVNVPYVMGAGNRVDLLIKAGEPGTYKLQILDPMGPYSVTPQGIAPGARTARIGLDFPAPTYPIILATIVVEGNEMNMDLPDGPLPETSGLPTREEMIDTPPDEVRTIAFEICGKRVFMNDPANRLPSCGWYFDLYDADYWGGVEFTSLLMARDADDEGIPNPVVDPEMPRIDYEKEGLFTGDENLFDNMFAGNFEEWTIINRTFSDHPFHIHVNPILITHINGEALPVPEWRDTILIPGATGSMNINEADFGTVTFRTFYDPAVPGSFVFHCHILTHEDVGMMQKLTVFP
ncbi:MAG: multicopper oxidase domain-containing protein [Candidatus Dadabacteria bacterium]|nr:multicopper oxidase domain-containing protein [Candidatus Dadabacteria bacterium]